MSNPIKNDVSRGPLTPVWGKEAAHRYDTWTKTGVAAWLADHQGASLTAIEILGTVCDALVAHGLPLCRVSCTLDDVHPQIDGRILRWTSDEGMVERGLDYADRTSEAFLSSPIKVIEEGAEAIRRQLFRADCPMDFPILQELRARGATDYLAAALRFSGGERHFMSWTTERPGGFTPDDLALIDDLMPLIALRIELEHGRMKTQTLLKTYLGSKAAERVGQGATRRHYVEAIRSVILYCDLRGFTALADRLPHEETVRVLGLYYERVAEHIHWFNGDIVKMIGDGILAIFPIPPGATPDQVDHIACGANAAVRKAMDALASVDPDELPDGVDSLQAGFALHIGDVVFGNVGSPDRLDFTVIGPAVNEVVRVECLTKDLGVPILTTAAFADLKCSVGLRSLGFHTLRGVAEVKELFTPV